uniref:Transmembrane protein 209 n=1 Tax=Haemonchus contortus TaxID=6289 RepID=A0A7I5E929_HAECO
MREGSFGTPTSFTENLNKSIQYSPVVQTNAKRTSATTTRLHRIKSTLLPWCIVLTALIVEIFTFGSSIGQFLIGDWLPCAIVIIVEYCLLVYVVIVAIWIIYDLYSVSTEKGFMHASFGMMLPSPYPHSKISKPHNLLDTSTRADSSWVDDHHFGKVAEDSPTHSRLAYASPNRSMLNDSLHQMDISTGSLLDSSMTGFSGNVVRSRHSPYSKTMDSIHTREQLDFLLSKDSSLHMDRSASRNSSFQYFNVLDIGAPEERRGYQLSEQLQPSDSKENIVVKMGPGSRIMLSPASSEGDGQDEMTRLRHALQHARHSPRKTGSILRRSESMERRRRSLSLSSPERPITASGSGTIPVTAEIDAKRSSLSDAELARCEQRLRAWLVNTILEPLNQRIKETNAKLEKEHASPPIKIGFSSVEALQAAMVNRPELLDTMLPYILPFLHVHSNQSYLVSRISELAADKFMMEYCWNGGGKEPVQEKTSSGRVARRPWGEHLPTDAVLVFSLFSAYMDSQLTSNPLVGSCRLAQPFSAVYTLRAPQRPNAVHLAAESFYLHMSNSSPPHFDFVFNDTDGSPSRAAIPRGARNLFSAILSFINHAKVNNGGRLDRMSIGPTGLNIACVLE